MDQQPLPDLARTPIQRVAALVAVAFGFVGLLGFVPGITTDYGDLQFAGHDSRAELLGLFDVSVLHNLVHLTLAVVGIVVVRTIAGARAFLLGGGAVYLALTLYGALVDRHSQANVVPLDSADNLLHLFLGIGMVALGLVFSSDAGRTPSAGPV